MLSLTLALGLVTVVALGQGQTSVSASRTVAHFPSADSLKSQHLPARLSSSDLRYVSMPIDPPISALEGLKAGFLWISKTRGPFSLSCLSTLLHSGNFPLFRFFSLYTNFSDHVCPAFGADYRRNVQDSKLVTLSLTLNASTTNATFATAICSNLTNVNGIHVKDGFSGRFFLLPECFWTFTATLAGLNEIKLQSVIIQGSAAQPDPLKRFSLLATSIELDHVRLVNYGASFDSQYNYAINWSSVWASRPYLTIVSITQANLQGTLPSTLPPLISVFNVTDNGLSGTIPSILTNINVSSLTVDLSHNKLTGTLDRSLFAPVSNTTTSTLFLFFNGNQLAGTIASDLLVPLDQTLLEYFTLDLSSNLLAGSIPVGFLDVNFTKGYFLTISFANNKLVGVPQSTFFSSKLSHVYWISINWSSNNLQGEIPNDFFDSFMTNTSTVNVLLFLVANNQFSGSIPNFWPTLALVTRLNTISVDLEGNQLTGTLPSSLNAPVQDGAFQYLKTVVWSLGSNRLSGTLPGGLIGESGSTVASLYVRLENNDISGTLPSTFTSSAQATESIQLILTSNALTGTLPENLLSPLSPGILDLYLDFSLNSFTGSIPTGFLQAFTQGPNDRRSLYLNMSHCGLSGSLPRNLRGQVTMSEIDLNHNSLSGDLPSSDLFSSSSALGPKMLFSASNNAITGTLALPSLGSPYPMKIDLSRNRLNALTIEESATYVLAFDVSENPQMTGSLPSSWFGSRSKILSVKAGSTSLSGTFPSVSTITGIPLQTLNLSNTPIAFCDGTRSAAWQTPNLTSCDLHGTSAINSCSNMYPGVCNGRFVEDPVASSDPTVEPSPAGSATSLVTSLALSIIALASLFLL